MKFLRTPPALLLAAPLRRLRRGRRAKLSSRRRRRRRRRRTSPQPEFNDALAEQKASLKSSGPERSRRPGRRSTRRSRRHIVDLLVQQAELGQEAKKLGITVTPAEVDEAARRSQEDELRRQREGVPGGDQEAGLHRRADPRQPAARSCSSRSSSSRSRRAPPPASRDRRLLRREPDAVPEARVAAVQEILVGKNKQALAKQIYTQLKAGADFAALAKKYSQDPGSKDKGGKFTATKGSDVPEFDAAVFARRRRPAC